MQADDRPWCGVEFLPTGTFPDGSPAPILCDLLLHLPGTMHRNEELKTSRQWQDADGNWVSRGT